MNESSGGSRSRFQVRLGDLAVLVMGSAYLFDVARRSREAWNAGKPYQDQVLGLIVLGLGVVLGLVVLGQGVRRLRERRGGGWAWGATWRLLAVGGLAWAVIQIAGLLEQQRIGPWDGAIGSFRFFMKIEVLPLVTVLGLAGLVLALSPIRRLARGSSFRPGWKSWLILILATVVGLVILSLERGIIPYLVLIAMEAVQNALPRAPLVSRPIVFDRLNLACLEALPGLAGCFLSALWINDDIRAAASDPRLARTPRSWVGMLARVATVALAAGGAGFVLLSSIPRLSAPTAEGIASIFEPSVVVALVCGLGGLAAGISAQGAARLIPGDESNDPQRSASVWPRRIAAGLVGLAAVEITAAAVQKLRGDFEYRWYIPMRLSDWISIYQAPAQSLGYTGALNAFETLLYQPSVIVVVVASVWVVYRMIRFFLGKSSDRPASLDLVVTDKLALGRFLGWWVGLTTVMLASLPILSVVGITLTHHGIVWMAK